MRFLIFRVFRHLFILKMQYRLSLWRGSLSGYRVEAEEGNCSAGPNVNVCPKAKANANANANANAKGQSRFVSQSSSHANCAVPAVSQQTHSSKIRFSTKQFTQISYLVAV